MAQGAEPFAIDEQVMLRGRQTRVTGRVQFESTNGQTTWRYLLSDTDGAPVVLEESQGQYALLRPFPPTARFKTAQDTVVVGTEKYKLASVRKLKVAEAAGNVPGAAAKATLILSGMFEGLMGTLMRELVPGTTQQVYYLLKPLLHGEVLTAAGYAAQREAESRAAVERALKAD